MCRDGELGAFLRRKRLYCNQINEWRRAIENGDDEALSKSSPGPKSKLTPEQRNIEQLERDKARLERIQEIGCWWRHSKSVFQSVILLGCRKLTIELQHGALFESKHGQFKAHSVRQCKTGTALAPGVSNPGAQRSVRGVAYCEVIGDRLSTVFTVSVGYVRLLVRSLQLVDAPVRFH